MKVKTRRLLWNRYYIITFLLLIIIPYLSWYFFSGYFEASFFWDLSHPTLTRKEYFQMIFTFQGYMVETFSLIQTILPLFTGLIMLPFLRDQRLYPYCYLRTKSYRRFVIGNILKYAVVGCFVLFLAYLVLMAIGAIIVGPIKLENERVLFADIFGKTFYRDHPVAYLILEGVHKYIVFGIVYALFFAAISFYTRRWYLCVLIPVVYYFGLDLMFTALSGMFSVDLFFFSPVYTTVPDGRILTSTAQVLLPLLPPLLFSILTFILALRRNRKSGDVYAVS